MTISITDNPGDAHFAFEFLQQVTNDWKGLETDFGTLLVLSSLPESRRAAIIRELTEQGLLENIGGRWKPTEAGEKFLERPFRSSWR